MLYKLIVEEKVNIWRHNIVEVEANSEQEAKTAYLDGCYEECESEFLFETEEVDLNSIKYIDCIVKND